MVSEVLMIGSRESGVIVWTPAPGRLKAMVSVPAAKFASSIACRSDPAPESAVFVTVKVAGDATAEARNEARRKDDAFISAPYWRLNVLTMNTAICPRVLVPSGQ